MVPEEANWLYHIGWFLRLPWPSLLFCSGSVKGFTGVDKHEMNFPEKFPKWGKVHGSEALVGNETGQCASVFLYKESSPGSQIWIENLSCSLDSKPILSSDPAAANLFCASSKLQWVAYAGSAGILSGTRMGRPAFARCVIPPQPRSQWPKGTRQEQICEGFGLP